MDGQGSYAQARERRGSRSSTHRPRAPSRASTGTPITRMSVHSANSSNSQLASNPPPRPSTVVHAGHRHQHSHSSCRTPTTPRPQSTAPRESAPSNNGGPPQSVVSSYLQEKLQKRREESERNAAARLLQDMTPPAEPPSRTAQSSPIKGGAADARRPQSSGGSERSEPTKKKGMGVKEMEATVSTLHKQNFDLKLELYHRRERQTALEERLDSLEAGKAQLEDVNDKLLEELEKRDRAVQEAVQMILVLEAQVEKLVKEREMVRQVEAAGFSRLADLTAALNTTAAQEPRVVNRMPSFLSERSESTANLRRVYLGTQGSLLNLPKVAETSPIADHVRSTSMALRSPSLSDLSESSFASVYGEKPGVDESFGDEQAEEMPIPDSVTLRSRRTGSNAGDAGMTPKTRPAAPCSNRSSSINRPAFQSLNNVVDQGSPLQRLERSFSSNSDSPGAERTSRPPPPTQHSKRTREDKRDSLRRVTTDGPRNYDHAMPPTPDTISTSTLRRFKNSNETLTHQRNIQDRSYLALTEDTASTSTSTPDDRADGGGAEHNGGAPISAPKEPTPATKVFSGGSYFDNRIPVAQRPRSADETTVSHRKGNAWDSDDEDDRASVQSLESSLDIWLQQGKEPKRRTGRESPDLFGFPSTANRWEGSAAYGQGAPVAPGGAPLHWPDPLDDLVPIQQELFGGGSGPAPPPPNRRSSLHARTGSTPPVTVRHHEPGNGKLRRAFSRAARRNSDTEKGLPQQTQQPEHPEGKQYPPLSRPQTVTPRNHRKINSLWRRSIGGSVPPASEYLQPPPPGPAPIDTAAANGGNMSRRDSAVGTPSWVQRASHVADEEARATPPPIQRQPRRGSMVDGDGTSTYGEYPQTPGTPGEAAQGGASLGAPGSARRKWLSGFGRTSSIRSRAGN